MRALTLLLALACLAVKANAQTYYISPAGDDDNAGTIDAPWATFAKAETILGPGDTLYVRGGTYSEWLRLNTNSGTPTEPIVYMEYPGESVVIDGRDSLVTSGGAYGLIHSGWMSYIYFYGFEIKNSNATGIYLGTGCLASGLTIHDCSGSGAIANGDSSIVENCHIYNVGMANYNGHIDSLNGDDDISPAWSPALMACRGSPTGKDTTDYAIIRGNVVHDAWGEGIDAFEARYATIEDNIVYDVYAVNLYLSDGGGHKVRRNLLYATKEMPGRVKNNKPPRGVGIYIYDERWSMTHLADTITNNMVMNTGRCLYIGEQSTGTLVANNTFVNSTYYANIEIWSPSYNYNFVNNIIIQENSLPCVGFIEPGNVVSTFSCNLWSKGPHSSAMGTDDVVGDPLLTKSGDATAGNLDSTYFMLSAGSPAIDAGTDVGLPYVGRAPDMGALEHDPTAASVVRPGRFWVLSLGVLAVLWWIVRRNRIAIWSSRLPNSG
jgi:hypothetical protein